jgi:calcineurin-like phosphoesterase family protein
MKVQLQKHQKVFFTSDTHYNHTAICRGVSPWAAGNKSVRDFDTLEEMNQHLVQNFNSIVGEDDVLFHLGDWSFGGFESIELFRKQLVCKNIHLILGNHDHHIERNKEGIASLFSSVNHYVQLDLRRPSQTERGVVDKHPFILCHFPIASWDKMATGMIHLHGHVHLPPEHRLGPGRSLDVGVDGNQLKPIQLEEVLTIVKPQPVKKLCLPMDHHETRI